MRGLPLALLCITAVNSAAAQATGLSAADARQIVMDSRATIWRDPYSIRDSRIGAPHSCPENAVFDRRDKAGIICVCVEANAKNAMGGYAGLSKTRLLIAGRKIVDAQGPLGTAMPDQCGALQPFPELSRGR